MFSIAKGKTALIDKEDYDKVSKYRWNYNNGAVCTNVIKDNRRTTIKLHRFILNLPARKPIVDHVNGNPLDNRKSNLRLCTHAENLRNRSMNSNNKSGYKGVYWHKTAGKWTAQVSVNGSKKHLGLFDKPEDAYKAYVKQAKLLHGEYFKC